MEGTITPKNEKLKALRLDEVIAGLPDLPASFQILPRLLTMLDDPKADCSDLAELIRIDPSLTAAVFRVANSAQFGAGKKAASLTEAIPRLGLREVYRVVLAIVTAPTLKGSQASVMGKVDLWQHSLATAVAAQTLAERLTQDDPEVVFSAGLLHDVGKTVLVRAARERYLKLLQGCADSNASVEAAERELWMIDHATVGGRLLRTWKFPEQIAAAVGGHHSLYTLCTEHKRLAALVYLGNVAAYRLGVGNGHPSYAAQPDENALRLVGLSWQRIDEFDREILERLQREQGRL